MLNLASTQEEGTSAPPPGGETILTHYLEFFVRKIGPFFPHSFIYLFDHLIISMDFIYIFYTLACNLIHCYLFSCFSCGIRVLSSWLLCLFALISSFMFFCFLQQILNFSHYVIPVSALDSAISPRSPVPFTE